MATLLPAGAPIGQSEPLVGGQVQVGTLSLSTIVQGAAHAETSAHCSVRLAVHDAFGTVVASITVPAQADTIVHVSSSVTSNAVALASISVKSSANEPPDGHGV
jgi:hypothetical protein